jgi:hypothetical protein
MKRLLLVAALLAGCDDESLPARVAAAQIHGVEAAGATCDCNLTNVASPFDTVPIESKYSLLIDGSAFIHYSSHGSSNLAFCARGEACASTLQSGGDFVESGKLVFVNPSPPNPRYEEDFETCCTGFNLEAFGVE